MEQDDSQKRKLILNRLKRIEGQVRGIQKMISQDAPCKEILIQLAAVRGAMDNTSAEILRGYTVNCLLSSKPDEERIREIDELVSLIVKLAF